LPFEIITPRSPLVIPKYNAEKATDEHPTTTDITKRPNVAGSVPMIISEGTSALTATLNIDVNASLRYNMQLNPDIL
jgi:hypothetical protein